MGNLYDVLEDALSFFEFCSFNAWISNGLLTAEFTIVFLFVIICPAVLMLCFLVCLTAYRNKDACKFILFTESDRRDDYIDLTYGQLIVEKYAGENKMIYIDYTQLRPRLLKKAGLNDKIELHLKPFKASYISKDNYKVKCTVHITYSFKYEKTLFRFDSRPYKSIKMIVMQYLQQYGRDYNAKDANDLLNGNIKEISFSTMIKGLIETNVVTAGIIEIKKIVLKISEFCECDKVFHNSRISEDEIYGIRELHDNKHESNEASSKESTKNEIQVGPVVINDNYMPLNNDMTFESGKFEDFEHILANSNSKK